MNEAMKQRLERTKWFLEDRFGLFIHWGLYSMLGRDAWVQSEQEITQNEYARLIHEFEPVRFDAGRWARMAKNAGMKYAVITSKHHEGFCMFDSRYTDFKSTNTKMGIDFIKECVEAFRSEGLKVGIYYSLLDWHHEDYPAYKDMYHPDRNNEAYKHKKPCFENYLEYMHNQVRELMTNYGKIDILWLDFSYEGHKGEDWKATELVRMARKLQPGIILNCRLEGSGESYGSIMTGAPSEFAGDFVSPEMIIPPNGLVSENGLPVPWEACLTLNNCWGYNPNDHMYKTSAHIIKKLVECTSKNGNMLLNVSPTGMGDIPEKQVRILEEVGEWMRLYSDSIYGCRASDFEKPEWGRWTQKGRTLYAHILEESIGPVCLHGLKGRVKNAYRMSDGLKMQLMTPWVAREFPSDLFMNFGLPDWATFTYGDTADTVIRLNLE